MVGGYASTATLGETKEGRAHQLPVERVGDLDVLWACLSPASLEERQQLYDDCAQEEAMGLGRRTPTGIASRILP